MSFFRVSSEDPVQDTAHGDLPLAVAVVTLAFIDGLGDLALIILKLRPEEAKRKFEVTMAIPILKPSSPIAGEGENEE